MLQKQLAVTSIGGHGMLDQELDVADQMSQAELDFDAKILHVLAVRAEVVAAQQSVKFLPQYLDENVRAARRIDLEQRVQRSPKAPGPQALPLIGVPGLIDIQPRFARQGRQQLLVGWLQAGAYLLDQLGQLATADGYTDHVAQKLANGRKRGMTGSLEKGDQRREPWPR